MKINKKEYTISKDNKKKIVLISDIHYKNKKDIKKLNKVLDEIRKVKPNFICITGDLTDKSVVHDYTELILWLKKLSKIAKVILSLGNHEFYIYKDKKVYGLNNQIFEIISNIDNLYLLDNKSKVVDDINFTGVTLPIESYENEEKKSNEVLDHINKLKTNKKYYNVLLVHSPVNIFQDEILNKYNLILCGHTHGGAVLKCFRKIFKNNGIISPSKRLFPKRVYGRIKNVVITSGLRVVPFKLIGKLFKPEIVVIKI